MLQVCEGGRAGALAKYDSMQAAAPPSYPYIHIFVKYQTHNKMCNRCICTCPQVSQSGIVKCMVWDCTDLSGGLHSDTIGDRSLVGADHVGRTPPSRTECTGRVSGGKIVLRVFVLMFSCQLAFTQNTLASCKWVQ